MMTRRQGLALGLTLGGATLAAGVGAAAVHGSDMTDYDAVASRERRPLPSDPAMPELVRLATLAPNSHNAQPWRFALSPGRIVLEPDFSRRTPVVDPDDHHLFVSLGAAAETLALAAGAAALPGALAFEAAGGGRILYDYQPGAATGSPLVAAITGRQTLRTPFDSRAVPVDVLTSLAGSVKPTAAELILITDPRQIAAVSALVVEGNNRQMTDPAFRAELRQWMRFNPASALRQRDGLFTGASGNPSLPSWLGPRLFDLFVNARSEEASMRALLAGTAGLAVIISPRDGPEAWVEAGRACQRFLLQATLLGLKESFVNQVVEVPALRRELRSLLGLTDEARPDIVIRFGYGAARTPELPRSLRRPVTTVITSA